MRNARLVIGLSALILLATLGFFGSGSARSVKAAATCAEGWTVVPTNNTNPDSNVLLEVEALTVDAAWAVGGFGVGITRYPSIEIWDGGAWGIATPNELAQDTTLKAVAPISQNDVWYVGTMNQGIEPTSFAVHWDGEDWKVVSLPAEGDLWGVSGSAPDDVWIVGESRLSGAASETLIMHWDGTAWSVVPSPNVYSINVLYDVVALAPDDAWAVGVTSDPGRANLTMHWNGSAWSVVPSPTPDPHDGTMLKGVAASSADDVWAVGEDVLHWDGQAWSVVETALSHPALQDVAVFSASDAWIVGYDNVVLHWDGLTWSGVANPFPENTTLTGAAVASNPPSRDLWVVGFTTDAASDTRTVAARFCGDAIATSSPGPAEVPGGGGPPSSERQRSLLAAGTGAVLLVLSMFALSWCWRR